MQRVPSGHTQTSHPAHAPRLPRPIPAQPASTARSVVEIGLHKLRRDLESCFLGACDDYGEVNARQRHPPPTSPTPHLLPADLKLVIASQLGFFMDAELPLVQQVRCLSRLQVAPAEEQGTAAAKPTHCPLFRQVERLQRLQRVLEVYVLAKGFMDLPSGTLRELMA